jgi:hypothetical protein
LTPAHAGDGVTADVTTGAILDETIGRDRAATERQARRSTSIHDCEIGRASALRAPSTTR